MGSSGASAPAVVPSSAGLRPANEYLLSFLARRYLLLQRKFIVRHPNPWLVWEPVEGTTEVAGPHAAETWTPTHPANRAVKIGDALCFELGRGFMEPAR